MQQRHKREVKALKVQATKMGKKKKDEIAGMELDLKKKHDAELAALDVEAAPTSQEDALDTAPTKMVASIQLNDEDDDVQGGDGRKLSKAQKRKIAKAKADAEREIRIAQEKSELGDSEKTIEEQAMMSALEPLELCMKEIKADGHCMYRSLEHQLSLHPSNPTHSYLELRKMTANYMRATPATFQPFIEGGEEEAAFAAYCDKVEGTAEWGGQLELQALAHALQRCIRVHSANVPDVQFGEEHQPKGEVLRLAYLKHAFGLGEHYNSVHPRSPIAADPVDCDVTVERDP